MLSKNIHLVGTCLKEGITKVLLYFRKSSRKSRKSKSKVVFFKVLPVFSTLYQVLFTCKKRVTFDDVCVCWSSSKIGFFFIQKGWFHCNSKDSYQKNYDVMRILI